MKPFPAIVGAAFLAAASLVAAAPATGQGETSSPPSAAASHAAGAPFTLILLGTRHADDVEVIRRNLAAEPSVPRLVPTVMSQGHLEFAGIYTGEASALIADVRGLALDRYDVVVQNDAVRGLLLTLRKIR